MKFLVIYNLKSTKAILIKISHSNNVSVLKKHTISKQPPNLLRLLSINIKNPRLLQALFNCENKNCKLCALYIKPCASFKTSNNVIWYIRSHITCHSKNVIYFLKCTSCNYSTTYIGKTVGLRSRVNNHISSCRLGGSRGKFHNHVFYWMQNQKQEPFFSNTNVHEISRQAEFTIL